MPKTTDALIKPIVVVLCLLSTISFAAGLLSTDYQIFTADINGDGKIDVLLRGSIIPIALDDLQIFVPLRPPVIITSAGSGSYAIDTAPSQSALSSTLWKTGDYQLLSADFSGDGNSELFVRALTPGKSSFVLSIAAGQKTPVLSQEMSPPVFGLDFGATGIAVSLADQNGDGRSDIKVTQNGLLLTILLSSTSGIFTPVSAPSTDDKKATIAAVWAEFRNALNSGNTAAAIQYYSATTQGKYTDIFNSLGAAIKTVTSNWSSATPISISDNFAEYAVQQTLDGQTRLHLIRFMRDSQGRWVIEEM